MINCYLIEDEYIARQKAEAYLSRIPFMKLVGSASNPLEITSEFEDLNVQVVFSDILMPHFKGTEFLRSLTHPPKFVFITAHPAYASESYNLDVTDYIVKPYSFDRLYKAAIKVRDELTRGEAAPLKAEERYTAVKIKHKYKVVHHRDIIYVEGAKDYVILVTATGEYWHKSTLTQINVELQSPPFIKTGKSHIINTQFVDYVGTSTVILENKKEIPISEQLRDEVYAQLGIPIKKRRKGR